MYRTALGHLFTPPSVPHPQRLQFESLFQLSKDGAKWTRVPASNLSKPVSITEGAALPRLLPAPVTPAGGWPNACSHPAGHAKVRSHKPFLMTGKAGYPEEGQLSGLHKQSVQTLSHLETKGSQCFLSSCF